MQRIGYSGAWLIVLAALCVLTLGIASLLLVQGLSLSSSRPATPVRSPTVVDQRAAKQAPTVPSAPTHRLQAEPTAAPSSPRRLSEAAKPAPTNARPAELGRPAVGKQATAEVSWIDVNSAANGVEVTIHLRNLQRQDLKFPFQPAKALSLTDAVGRSYQLSWAEYNGAPSIAAGGDVQLVRAFFVVPGGQLSTDHLVLQLKGVPGLSDARFDLRLPQPPTKPVAADQPVEGGGLTVDVADTKVETETNSVEIALDVANSGTDDVTFSFFPQRDLTLTDDDGNSYNLSWAAYDGEVKLKAGQQAQLVRAHFSGPIGRIKGKNLIVRVRNLPLVGGGAWKVPVQ